MCQLPNFVNVINEVLFEFECKIKQTAFMDFSTKTWDVGGVNCKSFDKGWMYIKSNRGKNF